jgi:hypothetical protein
LSCPLLLDGSSALNILEMNGYSFEVTANPSGFKITSKSYKVLMLILCAFVQYESHSQEAEATELEVVQDFHQSWNLDVLARCQLMVIL